MINLSTAALSAGPEVHQAFQHAMTLLPPYLAQTGYDQQGSRCYGKRLPGATANVACRRGPMK